MDDPTPLQTLTSLELAEELLRRHPGLIVAWWEIKDQKPAFSFRLGQDALLTAGLQRVVDQAITNAVNNKILRFTDGFDHRG